MDTHEIRVVSEREIESAIVRTFVYLTIAGVRRIATYIRPKEDDKAPFPVILYVHWYEPPHSNRHQFREEALEMAKRGAASLLIETLWSDIDFFGKRTQADDENNSLEQIVEMRQAMDILLSEPNIDPKRFAYVGHDFGAMYGVLLGSIDPRPTHYVLMAGTPRFHEWYLYSPPLEGDARTEFIQRMGQYDPIKRVGRLAPAPVFFQFADDDFHVPVPRAEEFFAAAQEPKKIGWYQAGHGLNETATEERIAWLTEQLGLA